MSHAPALSTLPTTDLIALIRPAADAWLNRQQLAALEELFRRLEKIETNALNRDWPEPRNP